MAVYLIVANQTIGGEQLTARLDELASAGPTTFRFLVPVTDTEGTHQWDYPPIDRLVPDAHRIARVLAEAVTATGAFTLAFDGDAADSSGGHAHSGAAIQAAAPSSATPANPQRDILGPV